MEHWPAVSGKHQTSDISAVIQEIINQEGWARGNALVIIISDNPDNPSVGWREAASGAGARAPLLHLELSVPFASEPTPVDGALLDETWVTLGWVPGISAVSHDVYFGDNFADVESGAESAFQGNQTTTMFIAGFPGFLYPEGLVAGTTYYWRIDEVEADGTTKYQGDVWSFTVPSRTAYNPKPVDGGKHVDPDVELSWTPGYGAKLHTVYFGESFDEVNNATGGQAQAALTYTPGMLESGKIYYWRVDEFDVVETHKGDVWSFKTLPLITITDPNLIGWWTFDEGSGSSAIDFSGHGNDGKFGGDPQWVEGIIGGALDLDGTDYVAIDGVADDITSTNISLSAWVKTTQSGEGNVFAANAGGSHPLMFGVKSGGEPYVNDGSDTYFPPPINDDQWHMLTYVRSGSRGYIYVDGVEQGRYSALFDLSGVNRWSIGQEWDTGPSDFYVGMVDDVRFYNASLTEEQVKELMRGDPLRAWKPSPDNNSTVDIDQAKQPLSWTAGDEASEHDVYFGTDKTAVENADASDTTGIYRGRQSAASYNIPLALEWGSGPYYWRVDEYNADGTISAGGVWSFSVADYLIVDDFEDYDVGNNEIWWVWLDGFGYASHPTKPPYPGNGSGSMVGDETTLSYMEETIVHGGSQSMPIFYNNNQQGKLKYSEVEKTLTSGRDWTREGVGVLTIWFRGETDNDDETLYVALNGNAIVNNDNSDAVREDTWIRWNIDLQAFADQGVNLANVNTIAIGLGNKNNPLAGGSGKIYIDDIRLYRPAP
ncbi:MAG: LamG domain-containing protein [Phycisphaerae bacterium]